MRCPDCGHPTTPGDNDTLRCLHPNVTHVLVEEGNPAQWRVTETIPVKTGPVAEEAPKPKKKKSSDAE